MADFRNSESDRLKERRLLYKAKTPPWKEAFRARCFQRMKNTRGRLLDKFRHLGVDSDKVIFDEVMKEEWNSLHEEQELPNLCIGDITEGFTDAEVNEFLSIYEEIQKEIIEEKMLLEKEYAQNEELQSLESTVNWLEKEEVICPICKKCPLHQLHSVIFCQCGLEIDTKQDGLTLLNLKEELYRGLETHDKSCSVIPTFLLLQYCDVKNLTITCEVCNFMYIVI